MLQIVDYDEIGIIARLQQPDVELVVPNGVQRGRFQHIKHVVTQLDGMTHQLVDMVLHQLIRVLVVGAEHQLVGVRGQQWNQGLEVLGGTAFANEDFHAEADFLQGLSEGKALMVSRNACADILLQGLTCDRWRMSIDGLAVFLRGGNLGHDFRVAIDDARVVHHLRKVIDFGRGEHFFYKLSIKDTTRRFKRGGRNTTRRTEEKLKRHLFPIGNHVVDTTNAKHVGDFVRVTDGGHRAVTSRQPRELRRHKHRAFDVHMRIDKARHDETHVAHGLFLYPADFAVPNDDHTRENL